MDQHPEKDVGSAERLAEQIRAGLQDVVENLELMLLGGLPINEPIVNYGPFVMNTRAEIIQAIDDFNSGKMGSIPALRS